MSAVEAFRSSRLDGDADSGGRAGHAPGVLGITQGADAGVAGVGAGGHGVNAPRGRVVPTSAVAAAVVAGALHARGGRGAAINAGIVGRDGDVRRDLWAEWREGAGEEGSALALLGRQGEGWGRSVLKYTTAQRAVQFGPCGQAAIALQTGMRSGQRAGCRWSRQAHSRNPCPCTDQHSPIRWHQPRCPRVLGSPSHSGSAGGGCARLGTRRGGQAPRRGRADPWGHVRGIVSLDLPAPEPLALGQATLPAVAHENTSELATAKASTLRLTLQACSSLAVALLGVGSGGGRQGEDAQEQQEGARGHGGRWLWTGLLQVWSEW